MKIKKLFNNAKIGFVMAIITLTLLMIVIGVSSLLGTSPPALGGIETTIHNASWIETIIGALLPKEYVVYTPTIISASVLVTLISLPLLVLNWHGIMRVLYEYTYTNSLFGVTIVGFKALITSLISGAIFLVVDNALQLGSGVVIIVLMLVAKSTTTE